MSSIEDDCYKLHQICSSMKNHTFPFNSLEIPENGIYILFEKGELGHGTNRIVRIGTHTGNNQLRSRLHQHFINENKDRSIFRKNIGRAILNKNHDPFIEQWELDLTTRAAKNKLGKGVDFAKQQKIEKQVTKYLQDGMSFVVFRVDDKKERLDLESKIISTVSRCTACGPSKNWLGNYSPKEKICKSGLWLVNELWKTPLSDDDIVKIQQLSELS